MAKRIVLFSHNSNLSGAPISISQLARKLPEFGYSPLLVLPHHGPLEQKLNEWDVEYRVLGKPFAAFEFISILRRERPLLVHVNSLVATWPVIVSRLVGKSVLWHVREYLGSKKFYARIIHALANRVVLISRSQYRLFDGMKKAMHVLNGVEPEDFTNMQPAACMSKEHEAVVSVVYIGSIEERKGLETLVRAAALLEQDTPVRFFIVGDVSAKNSSYKDEIKRLISGYELEKRFSFLGTRSDIPEILTGSDILCHPAYIEEFGRVILEAMASRIPVIASGIGEIKGMVEDGITGILVEPGNAADLSAALKKLCADAPLRQNMGERGHVRLIEKYSMHIHTEKIVGIYESILSEKIQDRMKRVV